MEKPVRSSLQNLGIAYECALAIGNSLNLSEMLHEVIHTMVHKTNAHRGIIWAKNGEKKLQPVASAGINIEDVLAQGEITDYHDVLDQIQKRQQFVLRYKNDKDFLQYCPVLTKKEECVLIVPVTNVAILHLIYASREIAYEPLANLLTSLSKKLSVAIEACMAHKNIVGEVQVRVEAEEELKKKTDQLIFNEKELQRLYGESEQARKSLLSILEDVTQKEEALHKSEEKFRLLAENSIDCIWMLDTKLRFTYLSPSVEEILGFKPEQLVGTKLSSHFKKKEFLKVGALAAKAITNYKTFTHVTFETKMLNSKNDEVDIEISSKVLLNSQGKLVGLQGTTKDITERKRAQQEIEMLLALSRQASAETSLDDLLFFIAGQIVDVIPSAEAASIFLYDEERKVINIHAWAGFSDNDVKGLEFDVDGSLTGKIFRNKKPTIVNDSVKDPDFKMLEKLDTDSIKSQIGVPLIYKKCVVGIIFADNLTRTDAFSQKNLDLLESIGNQLSGVIENTRLLEKVKESEEQYHSVVEDSPGLIDRFLPDGTITFVNQECCRFFGKTYQELIGTNIQSTIPKEDRESVMSNFASLTEESPIKISENKVIRHDGEVCWIRWADRALFDDQGQITSIQAFGQDVTRMVEAEQELRLEQEKAQKYLDIAEVIMLALNKKGEITLINQKGSRILGYQEDELIGKNWFETCLPERNRKEIKQVFNKIKAGSKDFIEHHENPVLTRSGEERIIAWYNTALRDEKGNIIGTLSSGEDITERKQAEQALKQEQERALKYLDIARVIIIALNKEGEITLVNQKGASILGYQTEELIEKNWFETCIPAQDREQTKEAYTKFMAGKVGLRDQPKKTVLTKLGEERIIDWHSTLLWEWDNEEKRIIGALSSGEDISKRVRAERLLNALNRASAATGKSLTHEEIFNAVAEELKQLDISCMLFPLDQAQGKLITKYASYDSAALTAAEKLVGIKHQDFSFSIDAVDVCREVVREKKTLFIDDSKQALQQMLPKLTKKLSAQIVKTLRARNVISAPLIVEDQVIGVFSMQSDILTCEDIAVAIAFADQLASAWKKVELLQNLRKTVEGTIHTIAATVEARDPYTAGHQKRVADLAAAIGSEMHLSDKQVEGIKMAGVVHDLGKINIPAEILSKPGKISELEYKIIQTHPQVGFDLLKEIEFPWPIAQMVLQHHEKMDGSGYPQGLKGEKIMLEARILAVADTVEAMSSHRPYRPAHGIEKALDQIREDRGTLLDPRVVDACLNIFKEGYKLPES